MLVFRERGIKLATRKLAAVFGAAFLALLTIGIVCAIISYRHSQAEQIANGIRVEEDSELDYYLDVKYDGIDRNGTQSSDSQKVEVRSGIMSVTDKLPDGLIFQGFVETSNGAIVAHSAGNSTGGCAGAVIDDTGDVTGWNAGETEYVWHGLHYEKATDTVSFKVKNVMAGCVVTVGVRTKTPTLRAGEKRRDFYNYASSIEDYSNMNSNLTHHWIGKDDDSTKYAVRYTFTGDVPNGAKLPAEQEYSEGSVVSVAMDPSVNGYSFSGWSTSDAAISDGKFTMPASDVTLVGSFTVKTKYDVTYKIETEAPEAYLPPAKKSYSAGDSVELDTTQAGWVYGGYRFLGWTFDRMVVENGRFTMPEANVTIHGSFEKISYTVNYAFLGDIKPSNWESLLPASQTQYPGDEVHLAAAPSAAGYEFLGWMTEDGFEMPEENVTVYGKWASLGQGIFKPEIEQTIVNPQDKYYADDEVKFKITVKNTANYKLKNVNVFVDQKGTTFDDSSDSSVELKSSHLAQIDSLDPGEMKELRASYDVHEDYETTIENPVELLSASADNHAMDTSTTAMRGYRKVATFNTGVRGSDPTPDPNPDPNPNPNPDPTPDPNPDPNPNPNPDPTPDPEPTPDSGSTPTPDSGSESQPDSEPKDSDKEEGQKTPETLDNIMKFVGIFAICGGGLAAALVAIRKAQRR